jgi:hypothetical protein
MSKHIRHLYEKFAGYWFYVPTIVIYFFSLAALGFTSFPQYFFDSIYINSDSIFYTYYLQDIFVLGKDPRLWLLPHAFLFFPEFFLYLFTRLFFGNNIAYVNFFSSVLLLALVQGSFVYVLYKFFSRDKNLVPISVTLLSLTNILLTKYSSALFYFLLLSPHFHVGTLFTTLFSSVLLYKYFYKGPGTWKLLYTLLLCFSFAFLTISDPLYLVYFTLPAVVTIFALYIMRKLDLTSVKIGTFLLLLSGSLGLFLYTLLPITAGYLSENPLFPLLPYKVTSSTVLLGWFASFLEIPNPTFLLAALVIFGAYSFFSLRKEYLHSDVSLALTVFYLVSVTFSVLAYLVFRVGMLLDFRFALPVFVVSTVLIIHKLSELIKKARLQGALLLLVPVVLLAHFRAYNSSFLELGRADYNLTSCITQKVKDNGWESGVSDYWIGVKASVLSEGEVSILPVYFSPEGKVVGKIFLGYRKYADGSSVDYVVSGRGLSDARVRSWLGEPDLEYICTDSVKVLYYADEKIKQNLPLLTPLFDW